MSHPRLFTKTYFTQFSYKTSVLGLKTELNKLGKKKGKENKEDGKFFVVYFKNPDIKRFYSFCNLTSVVKRII